MWIKLLSLCVFLFSFLAWTPTPALGAAVRYRVHHRPVHYQIHHRYYIRHRSKLQHAKIIGGSAKTGASIGGLVGGPPGMAVGAVAGAGVGTAYDLKTRKVRTRRERPGSEK